MPAAELEYRYRDLRELEERAAGHAAYQIAEVYAARGDLDAAFQWLHRSCDQLDGGLIYLRGRPPVRDGSEGSTLAEYPGENEVSELTARVRLAPGRQAAVSYDGAGAHFHADSGRPSQVE